MRIAEKQFAATAFSKIAGHIKRIPPTCIDSTGHQTISWLRRAVKKFNVPESIEAAASDERLLRILEEFGEAKLTGKAAVSGELTEEDLALLCLVLEVDKTQQKLKVDRRLQKLAEKTIEDVLPQLRLKSNQPVQAVSPSSGMYMQYICRMVCEIFVISLLPNIVVTCLAGLRTSDLHKLAFRGLTQNQLSTHVWQELDIVECDASHFRAVYLFVSAVIKCACPEASPLIDLFCAIICSLGAHWRSRSVTTK